jgi:FKBP-type peptidyl-prolyl cis-trans isomerase
MKLSNGVLYRQLKAGAGKTPGANSSCVCVCKGTLVDGTVFFNGSARSADGVSCTLLPHSLVQVCVCVRLNEVDVSL